MGQQIIKQPNGKYAVWSTIVDDFILLDATPEQIIQDRVKDAKAKIEQDVKDVVRALDKGEKPYYQFTKTFDEAVNDVRQRNEGSNSLTILKEMKLIK